MVSAAQSVRLGAPCLQQVQNARLHRELEVLGVARQRFQLVSDFVELRPDCGRRDAQSIVVAETLTPGHDIFALRIEAKVEIEFAGARCWISGESDAGPRRASGVTVHHGLNGHSRACAVADAIQPAICRRFRRVP